MNNYLFLSSILICFSLSLLSTSFDDTFVLRQQNTVNAASLKNNTFIPKTKFTVSSRAELMQFSIDDTYYIGIAHTDNSLNIYRVEQGGMQLHQKLQLVRQAEALTTLTTPDNTYLCILTGDGSIDIFVYQNQSFQHFQTMPKTGEGALGIDGISTGDAYYICVAHRDSNDIVIYTMQGNRFAPFQRLSITGTQEPVDLIHIQTGGSYYLFAAYSNALAVFTPGTDKKWYVHQKIPTKFEGVPDEYVGVEPTTIDAFKTNNRDYLFVGGEVYGASEPGVTVFGLENGRWKRSQILQVEGEGYETQILAHAKSGENYYLFVTSGSAPNILVYTLRGKRFEQESRIPVSPPLFNFFVIPYDNYPVDRFAVISESLRAKKLAFDKAKQTIISRFGEDNSIVFSTILLRDFVIPFILGDIANKASLEAVQRWEADARSRGLLNPKRVILEHIDTLFRERGLSPQKTILLNAMRAYALEKEE